MNALPPPLLRLIAELSKLPGVGEKTATRFAFHVLQQPETYARALAGALTDARERICHCEVCFNITEAARCGVCSDPSRDRSIICVVEDVPDLFAVERSGQYRGVYHVLHGVLAPLRGKGPDDIRIAALLERVRQGGVRELIVATNVGVEGEATALYIKHTTERFGVSVSRIAAGIPMGGDLEYIDQLTIARAIDGRRAF